VPLLLSVLLGAAADGELLLSSSSPGDDAAESWTHHLF